MGYTTTNFKKRISMKTTIATQRPSFDAWHRYLRQSVLPEHRKPIEKPKLFFSEKKSNKIAYK